MTKKDDPKGASLLDKQATGGDVAEGGFSFQDGLIVARVPSWLADDGFTQMIREALGDVEASFFEPGFGLRREFVEYKNHNLPPGEFWPEVQRFHEMDTRAPGAYRRFVLACKSVSADVQPMVNALRRVRDAFPFFDGVPPIQDQSFQDFEMAVEKALGKWSKQPGSWTPQAIAKFLFRAVEFEVDVPDAEKLTREMYRVALEDACPATKDASGALMEASQRAVVELVKSRKNKPILRQELEERVWKELSVYGGFCEAVRLFTQHDAASTSRQQGS
jgi:hypothetical protein